MSGRCRSASIFRVVALAFVLAPGCTAGGLSNDDRDSHDGGDGGHGGTAGASGHGGDAHAQGGSSDSDGAGGMGGEGTAGAAGEDGGGGEGGTNPVMTGGTGGTPPIPAPVCPGRVFCDDFESYPAGQRLPTTTYGTQANPNTAVVVATDKAYSGSKSVRIDAAGQQATQRAKFTLSLRNQLQSPQKIGYARMMVWLDNTPGVSGSSHWNLIGMSGIAQGGNFNGFVTVSFGGFGDNSTKFLYFHNNVVSGAMADCAKRNMPLALPLKRWTCVELKIDETSPQHYGVKLDGNDIPGFSFRDDNAGSICVSPAVNQGRWYVPDVTSFSFGWEHFHPQTRAVRLWIDDIVVDEKPIGCP